MRKLRRAHQKYAREQAKRRKKFKQQAIAVGTVAAITLGAGVGINKALAAYTPDAHELPVSQDVDADLLANKEEVTIGYHAFKADQNRNQIPDGVELAKRCAADINNLPIYDPNSGNPEPNGPYRVDLMAFGMEMCDICGLVLNMGGPVIFNPRLGSSWPPGPGDLWLPFMSLHYMEHGSFSFSADEFTRRIDVAQLLRVLDLRYPNDPNNHQLPVESNDTDSDLLTDTEELAAGYNLYDPDQDNDLTPDGIELAKQCAAVIDKLPWENEAGPNQTYKWWAPTYGLETCQICGAQVNMGPAGIVNPQLGITVDCPLIAIHYMGHGSFSYSGDVHGTGRIDVAALVRALEMPRRCGDLGTMYLPGDLNKDCKVDLTDFAELTDQWLGSTEPN